VKNTFIAEKVRVIITLLGDGLREC